MAVHLAKYEEWPQIGSKVLSSCPTSVTLAWYDGTYSSIWSPVRIKHGKDYNEWTETLDTKSILLYDIKLTSGQHLRKDCIDILKSCYDTLNS